MDEVMVTKIIRVDDPKGNLVYEISSNEPYYWLSIRVPETKTLINITQESAVLLAKAILEVFGKD
jgi:hypothetical protein